MKLNLKLRLKSMRKTMVNRLLNDLPLNSRSSNSRSLNDRLANVVGFSLIFLALFALVACGSTKKVVKKGEQNQKGQKGKITVVNPKYKNQKNLAKVSRYRVIGLAQITDSGKQTAYDQAIEHALRKAVEQALGVYVDARTKINNQTLINDKIYARSYGFIQKYEIIRTWEEEETLYQELDAWVVLADIEDDILALDILQDRANKPNLIVKIQENDFAGKSTDFAERKISEKFLAQQFTVLSPAELNARQENSPNASLSLPSLPLEAEIVVQGKIVSSINDTSKNKYLKDSALKSVTTSLNLSVYTANDAKLIGSFTDRLTAVALNENLAQQKAVVKLADKVARTFIEQIKNKWDKAINNGFEYQVLIRNVSPEDSNSLKSFIKKRIQGIKAVFDKGFQRDELSLLIRFTGNPSELADYLDSPRNPIPLEINYYNSKVVALTKNDK